MTHPLRFTAAPWETESFASWVFVTLPAELSEEIREAAGEPRGFGSVRVEAMVGATTWCTSVFPDKRSGCFVLPLKRAVREAEGVEVGVAAEFTVTVVEGGA